MHNIKVFSSPEKFFDEVRFLERRYINNKINTTFTQLWKLSASKFSTRSDIIDDCKIDFEIGYLKFVAILKKSMLAQNKDKTIPTCFYTTKLLRSSFPNASFPAIRGNLKTLVEKPFLKTSFQHSTKWETKITIKIEIMTISTHKQAWKTFKPLSFTNHAGNCVKIKWVMADNETGKWHLKFKTLEKFPTKAQ